MLENVLYEKKGALATVTVNRPKVLNALNTPTWADLRTAFEDARDDDAVRGVILTGAGEKAFIAGADIGELAHATAIDAEQSSRFGQGVLELIENLGKPVMRPSTALHSAAVARPLWPARSGSQWTAPSLANPR
jgi:enoyl-CoA hydratase